MAMAEHKHHHYHADSGAGDHAGHGGGSLNQTAFQATVHCLTGCAIGEAYTAIIRRT